MKKKSARRDFLKHSVMGLGGLAFAPGMQSPPVKATSTPLRILCLGAHPGDPEFGCGGTMARYHDAGHEVIFLYLTRGEASDPKKTHAEMAALRSQEAAMSCKILGATAMFAGQFDGDTQLTNSSNAAVKEMILSQKPDLVFTQWPVDGHPDHQVTGLLALNAWVHSGRNFQLYFYEVNTGMETMAFSPTDYVDITGVQDRKKAAMFAHNTQDPVNTYDTYFKPLETFRGLEAGVKAAEAFIHFKSTDDKARLPGLNTSA